MTSFSVADATRGGQKMGSSKGGRKKIDKNTNMYVGDGPSPTTLSPSPSLTGRTAPLNTKLIAAEISCETLQGGSGLRKTHVP